MRVEIEVLVQVLHVEKVEGVEKGLVVVLQKERRSVARAWKAVAWSDM